MAIDRHLFGVVYMLVMVGAVPVVGTAVATVAVIVGQLGMGMLIDNFGWLGNPAIELSGSRIVAMACLPWRWCSCTAAIHAPTDGLNLGQ
jgi:transporter family-2 protein